MRITDQRMTQDEFAAYIAQKIKTLHLQSREPQLVALSGPDCAGKSTLAVDIQEQLHRLGLTVTLFSIDAFLIPRHLRVRNTPEFIEYFEHAFDYSALTEALETARYSAASSSSNGTVLDRRDILLVEGVFLLRKELSRWWNLTVWIEVDTCIIINRAIKRDKKYFGDEKTVRRVYETRYLPAQQHHLRRDAPEQTADITAKFEKGIWVVPLIPER